MTEYNLQANDIDLESFVSIKSVVEFIEHLNKCNAFNEHFDPAKELQTFSFDWLN
jgi:hypothetical protein